MRVNKSKISKYATRQAWN